MILYSEMLKELIIQTTWALLAGTYTLVYSGYGFDDIQSLIYSHVEQDAPAAVRISGAQTLGTRSVLITALYRNTLHLHTQKEILHSLRSFK